MNMDVTLRWEDVSYSVPEKTQWWRRRKKSSGERTERTERRILHNVCGQVSTGNLVAIVGASGAGKTTLLAAISRRIRGNKLAGKFTINSREIDREDMTRISGFVPQSDSLIDVLTVQEHLIFTMLLKFSRTTTKESRTITIRKILTQLELMSLARASIGTLSGGERKKLNLATELLSEPYFLFCDEPTTGLDSFSALQVINTLRNLCRIKSENSENFEMEIVNSDTDLWQDGQDQPRTLPKAVVCSIHQPTSDIFHCFSEFVILREGRVVFQGTSIEAEEQFREAGFICPDNYNPMEFYVKTVSVTSDLDLTKPQTPPEDQTEAGESGSWRIDTKDSSTLWIFQVFYLIWRACIVARRSVRSIVTMSAFYLSLPVIFSLAYQDVNAKTQTSIQDIAGLLFSCCCELVFTYQYSVIMSFSPVLPLIRRETGEGLFSISAFYFASVLQQIPRAFIESFIFLAIINAIPGFTVDFWTYLQMSMLFSCTAVASMAYGFLISGVFVKEKLVNEVSVPIDTLMMVLGGFYLNVNAVSYFKYLSLFFLSNEAISVLFWRNVGSIECPTETNCLRNGTDVLTYYSFDTEISTIWRDYLGLSLWFVICHTLGFLGLRRYVHKEGFY